MVSYQWSALLSYFQLVMVNTTVDGQTRIPTFIGHSRSGAVTGRPVYINDGSMEDLEYIGVSVLCRGNLSESQSDIIAISRASWLSLSTKLTNLRTFCRKQGRDSAVGSLLHYQDPLRMGNPSDGLRVPGDAVMFKHASMRSKKTHGDPETPLLPSIGRLLSLRSLKFLYILLILWFKIF